MLIHSKIVRERGTNGYGRKAAPDSRLTANEASAKPAAGGTNGELVGGWRPFSPSLAMVSRTGGSRE